MRILLTFSVLTSEATFPEFLDLATAPLSQLQCLLKNISRSKYVTFGRIGPFIGFVTTLFKEAIVL